MNRTQALVAAARRERSHARWVEWGVVLDDAGSTDLYDDEAEARAAADKAGGTMVKIYASAEAVR